MAVALRLELQTRYTRSSIVAAASWPTLCALGFTPGPLISAILAESTLLALSGAFWPRDVSVRLCRTSGDAPGPLGDGSHGSVHTQSHRLRRAGRPDRRFTSVSRHITLFVKAVTGYTTSLLLRLPFQTDASLGLQTTNRYQCDCCDGQHQCQPQWHPRLHAAEHQQAIENDGTHPVCERFTCWSTAESDYEECRLPRRTAQSSVGGGLGDGESRFTPERLPGRIDGARGCPERHVLHAWQWTL